MPEAPVFVTARRTFHVLGSAVLVVVCLALLPVGVAGWVVVTQVTRLINDLPQHKENVREKIRSLQGAGQRGLLMRVEEFVEEVEKASQPAEALGEPVVRVQAE